jgi:lipoprotein NlpI
VPHLSQRAVEDYDKAISQGHLSQDDLVRLQVGRGYAYLSLTTCSAAAADFTAALKFNPAFSKGLKWHGLYLERMDQTDKAVRDYEAALELKPLDSVLAKKLRATTASESIPTSVDLVSSSIAVGKHRP